MSIFNFFRNKNKTSSDSNKLKIEFGFRGEDITYHLQGKETYISLPGVMDIEFILTALVSGRMAIF